MTPDECRGRREAVGATQAQLARHAGLVERTVWKLEAGLAIPRPVTVVALRKALRRLEADQATALGSAGARADRGR